jgi:hypothetical protein
MEETLGCIFFRMRCFEMNGGIFPQINEAQRDEVFTAWSSVHP